MTTVDEMLADPVRALSLLPGAVPTHAVMLVEYAEPGSDDRPTARRLAMNCDDDCPPWLTMGMLRYAASTEDAWVLFREEDAIEDDD